MNSPQLCVWGSHTKHTMQKQTKPKSSKKGHLASTRSMQVRREAKRTDSMTERAPVAVSEKQAWRDPVIRYRDDGSSCRIQHRERIGTLLGSVAFTATSYSINPGLVTSFPWLSGIANRFESYRFNSLVFEFKTKSATTGTGDVILATDYDASDSAPSTSIQMETYQGFRSAAPWQNQSMPASKQNLTKLPSRYVRDSTAPSGTDVKLYDVGNFFVATENQASAALVGYLYVSYDVVLMTPQLRSSDFYISGGYVDALTATSAANPTGTSPVVDAFARGISVNAASLVTIANPGEYAFALQATGTVISAIGATAVSGCTVSDRFGTTVNSAATSATKVLKVVVTSYNATLTITATATTITEFQLNLSSQPVDSFSFAFSPDHMAGCPIKNLIESSQRDGKPVPVSVIRDFKCGCKKH